RPWWEPSTTRPGARRAHRPAAHGATPFFTGPRPAGSFQPGKNGVIPWATAGLRRPSLRRMASQTLRRRNAARVPKHGTLDRALPALVHPLLGAGQSPGRGVWPACGGAGRGADFVLAGRARPGYAGRRERALVFVDDHGSPPPPHSAGDQAAS